MNDGNLCAHFGTCGGCTLQDLPPQDYRARKLVPIAEALKRNGIVDAVVADLIGVPANTRRRAVFKIAKKDGAVEIGFHALKSHTIVDMRECRVLTPKLFAAVAALREAMGAILSNGQHAEAHATEADNGIDIAFRAAAPLSPARSAALADAGPKAGLIRAIWNGELAFERDAPMSRFGKCTVTLPPFAFLQPTREGEAILRHHVLAALKGAKMIADLFAGCGTFALPLAEKARVHAVELDGAMLVALVRAARGAQGLKPVTTEKRDLFKRPLAAAELGRFDAVVLDPPRAGAPAQARTLAGSKVKRIAYVSCDAASFARDAKILLEGGYRMGEILPVDQFLWSEHIELVTGFTRG
jgi:23S rRNA (uracil1939-C5)-methyltransferase